MTDARRTGWRALPWGVIDQFCSAGSNALIVVLAARRLDADEMGRFSLAIAAALILLGISRAWLGQPLIIAHGAADRDQQDRQSATALAGGLRALGPAVVLGLAATVFAGDARGVMAALALGIVPLVLQDATRSVYFLQGRPWGAAASDALWLAWVIAAAVAGAAGVDAFTGSAAACMATWVVGALVAALVALAHLRMFAAVAHRLRSAWFRPHAPLGWGLLADTSLVTLYGFAIPFVLAAVADVDDAGSFRLAQTLTGPATLVTVGAATQLLPQLVRARAAGAPVRPAALRATATYAAISAAYTLALVVLPESWGTRLVGGAWADARATSIALGVAAIAFAGLMAALLLLRSAAATTLLARTRLLLFPVQLAAVVTGAALHGSLGAAVGLATANWLSVPVWWWVAGRAEQPPGRQPAAQPGAASRRRVRSGRAGTPT